MKRVFLLTFVMSLAVGAQGLQAQSNDLIDSLLAEPQASYGKAAYMALAAAGLLKPDAGPAEALSLLSERGWAVADRGPDAPVSTGEFAFILMKAFDKKGGLLYRLFPGPRYATRELTYERLLGPKAGPSDALPGAEVVRLVGEVAERKGGRS
jgi:hypothetical protein